jgi:galactarate dehydratase (D-threo-forming)
VKIQKIEVIQIETPRFYGYVSGHVLVKIHVQDGPIGWGEASDMRTDDVPALAAALNEQLIGRDARQIVEINEFMCSRSWPTSISHRHLVSAIDLGLYDLNGKVQGVPVYQMLGGKVRDKLYCCYPIFGWQVREDFEQAASYLQRLVDLGHHLFRFYVSGDAELDDRFLTEMKSRHGDALKLKSIDFSGRFKDWELAIRYGAALRHHDPFHFEQPSRDMRVSAQFTKRVDLPVTWHIDTLQQAYEAADTGACTAYNVACVAYGPTNIKKILALGEGAGMKCLIGTDQESTLGMSAQVAVGISSTQISLPCDPMGPVLYNTSPAKERVKAEGSYLTPFEGPGLGVEIDEAKLVEMTVASA